MKFLLTTLTALSLTLFISCSDDAETITLDSSQPSGTFTSSSSGSFVAQNDSGSAGTAELGKDSEGTQFLHFSNEFKTNQGTGTVTIYMSTSATFTASPGTGNPDLLLVGAVKTNGEKYFKIAPVAASKFTHVILWCGSANVTFGNAELK